MLFLRAAAGAHPMGMNLTSNFSMGTGTTAQVTGWTARSGFPSTVITSSKLVADNAGTWTVNSKTTVTSSWGTASALTMTIMKNASSFGTYSVAFGSSSGTFTPASITLARGDLVWLEYTTPFGASGTLSSGSTNTFLTFS
ncbi:hypothetical protein [Nocardia sp. NBC_01327]|uniref:hypothetical protein n=1 Tax=Nocardia sp. NBC_01327 TaxID=2903593 RepID=UPI002E0DD45E|nr:hypothetical protein OG326_23935 [Nocardia sp. NBC_01327]